MREYILNLVLLISNAQEVLPELPNYDDLTLKTGLIILVIALGRFSWLQVNKKDQILKDHAQEKDTMHEGFRKEIIDIQEKTTVVLNLQQQNNKAIKDAIDDLKQTFKDYINNHSK